MEYTRVHPVKGQHKALGEKIVEWSLNPETIPPLNDDGSVKDLEGFKAAMAPYVKFPDEITKIKFISLQTDDEGNYTYYIRVPLKQLVEKSQKELSALQKQIDDGEVPAASADYAGLEFYEDFIGSPSTRNHPEMLLRRIADYTFSGCK